MLYIWIYLESLVLQDFLDGCIFPGVCQLGLIHYSERAIPNHFVVGILQLDIPAGSAIFGRYSYCPAERFDRVPCRFKC